MQRSEGLRNTEHLTGLRAVAALFVYLIHSGGLGIRSLGHWASNFVDSTKFGVAIFFVISAYCLCLITSEVWNGGRADWLGFYIRRVFRIIPMYFLALFAAVVLLMVRGAAPPDLGWSLLSHVTFFNIIDNVHSHDIFVEWTVVVEFAFYGIFPLILLVARKIRWVVLLVAVLFSWRSVRMVMLGSIGGSYSAYFYFTLPFHIYAFLFGVVAFIATRRGPWTRAVSEVTAWGCVAYMLWSMGAPDDNANEVPITWATAGIIVACANAEVSLARLLRLRPLVYLGTISFSIYLVHTLVLQFAPGDLLSRYLALVMTVAIASLTYVYVEDPFRRLGRRIAASRSAKQPEGVIASLAPATNR